MRDAKVSPFYTNRWSTLDAVSKAHHMAHLQNMSAWDWGHSDFDWCCDDNKAPTYLLYMVTSQGMPKTFDRKKADWFQAIGRHNGTILDWLRSYFTQPEAPVIV